MKQSSFFPYLVLITGLGLSAVAAWFSVVGLMTIFSTGGVPIMIMGALIETAKIVGISYLYRNWASLSVLGKSLSSVVTLSAFLVTSIGIFGYLSQSQLKNTASLESANSQLFVLERKISRVNTNIEGLETLLSQLDETVNTLIKYDKISGKNGARAVRASQEAERQRINESLDREHERLDALLQKKLELQNTKIHSEADIGALKYVGGLLYEDVDSSRLNSLVSWFILLLMLCFDPLAIMLVMYGNRDFVKMSNRVTNSISGTSLDDYGGDGVGEDTIIVEGGAGAVSDDVDDTITESPESPESPESDEDTLPVSELETELPEMDAQTTEKIAQTPNLSSKLTNTQIRQLIEQMR